MDLRSAGVRTITIVNQKGGCGKTTTAINLAAVFARRGRRTLLIDMDPQSHCAAGLGVPESRIDPGIGEALLRADDRTFDPDALFWEAARNLDLAPSTTRLAALEAPGGGLHELPDRDRRLDLLLRRVHDRYDICLIDCPPTIGLLTFNALRAAREALIPVETGFFSLRGAEKQWKTIQRTIERLGRPMACYLLPTLHNPSSQNARDILSALQRQASGELIPAIIREHESLREAASYGQPIVEYAPDSPAHHDFEALADWLTDRADHPDLNIEVLSSRNPAEPGSPPLGTNADGRAERRPHGSGGPASIVPPLVSTVGAINSRAAELVQRVREISRRTDDADQSNASADPDVEARSQAGRTDSPRPAAPIRVERPADNSGDARRVSHLYGARCTSRGVLFVQPGDSTQSIHIAGEFNHWSPTADRLRYNPEAGVYQTMIELPPGRFQYRLIIDGQWQRDPYNPSQELNAFGVANSVIVVEELKSAR